MSPLRSNWRRINSPFANGEAALEEIFVTVMLRYPAGEATAETEKVSHSAVFASETSLM